MTGQLISCLANCVLLLSLSLISILGSEILMALYLLTSLLSLLSVWFDLFVPVLFKSALPWSMSHTSNYVLDWQYRLSRTLCILHFLAPQ